MSAFPKRLKNLRLEANLTQKELADKCGVLERTVSHWETGKRECDFDTLMVISKIFEVSTDYLLGMIDYI